MIGKESIVTGEVVDVVNVVENVVECAYVTLFAPSVVIPVKFPDTVSPALFAGVYPSAVVTSEDVRETTPVLVLNDRIPLLVIVNVPEETDVEMEFEPDSVSVPPPETVPVPVFPARLIVVETEFAVTFVSLPYVSTTIVGIDIAEPYVPAETPDGAKSKCTSPEVAVCVIVELEFADIDVTGVCVVIDVILP